jgi:hypothetical protein
LIFSHAPCAITQIFCLHFNLWTHFAPYIANIDEMESFCLTSVASHPLPPWFIFRNTTFALSNCEHLGLVHILKFKWFLYTMHGAIDINTVVHIMWAVLIHWWCNFCLHSGLDMVRMLECEWVREVCKFMWGWMGWRYLNQIWYEFDILIFNLVKNRCKYGDIQTQGQRH